MDYISAKEAASKWGLTARKVYHHCTNRRIEGRRRNKDGTNQTNQA